jgi:hypothetical protein
LSSHVAEIVVGAPAAPSRALRTAVLLACAAAAAAGLLGASQPTSSIAVAQASPDLVMLLRFMAGMKALAAVALLALVAWRLGRPAPARLTAAYIVAVVLMSAAPGMIFQMVHVAAGAVLFHAGLLTLLVAVWADRGGRSLVAARVTARRGAASA